MLQFINLFLVPVITVHIMIKRGMVDAGPDIRLIGHYAVSVISNVICSFLLMKILEKAFGMGVYSDTREYTVMAAFLAVIIAYISELIRKYLEVRIEIKSNDDR